MAQDLRFGICPKTMYPVVDSGRRASIFRPPVSGCRSRLGHEEDGRLQLKDSARGRGMDGIGSGYVVPPCRFVRDDPRFPSCVQ